MEDVSIDGRVVLCIDWIDLSQDSDRWQAFVNVVMNLWVHRVQEISCPVEPLASQEALSSMEFVN